MNNNELNELISTLREIKTNKPIVGILPHLMVPYELVYASQCHPLLMCIGGDDEMSTIGTEYLTQATCPFARSIIGYFQNSHPIFELIGNLIGGNYCNGDLTGSEMIKIYFNRNLIPIIFPTTSKPNAQKFFYWELKNLKKRLEKKFDVDIKNQAIRDAINKFNQMRSLFRRIEKQKVEMSFMNHIEFQKLIYKAMLLGPDVIIPELEKVLDNNQSEAKNLGKKIILTGSIIAMGDEFLEFLSSLDIDIIINDTEFGRAYYESDIQSNHEDPFKDLVDYYLKNTTAARMYPNNVSIPRAINFYKKYNAEGVINHILKFCDPYVANKSLFKEKLAEEGIPTLEIERDYSTTKGQLMTRIEAFLEMI